MLRNKLDQKVPVEVRLGLALFFVVPQIAWKYYIEWVNSDKYIKLNTFKEDVFEEEQRGFFDAEDYDDDEDAQYAIRGGDGVSDSEKRIITGI